MSAPQPQSFLGSLIGEDTPTQSPTRWTWKPCPPDTTVTPESDPTGRDPHQPGAKLDAGKLRADLMLDGFPRALTAVAEVATYGATKYTPHGWMDVPDGETRYRAAGDRHRLARSIDGVDDDSGLYHLAHEAWNRLAELELMLRSHEVDTP